MIISFAHVVSKANFAPPFPCCITIMSPQVLPFHHRIMMHVHFKSLFGTKSASFMKFASVLSKLFKRNNTKYTVIEEKFCLPFSNICLAETIFKF